ncbi:hypothetical protein Tco_0977928 [Tanacetum coccineum]|uniref:Uncharacterized protein n=1 Tax=Tanacetum coccineum TaxID=301880 RepID=A0ABQ5ELI4_9ASTR
MSSYNQFGCSYCGGPFNGGNCPSCSSVGSGNEFVYDPNPYSYNETPNFFNQPPQYQYETYSCEFCGENSHPGFDCQTGNTPVFDQGPCYNQDFGFNQPLHYFLSQPQQFPCENCGGPHATFQCQPLNQNFYSSNSFGFDQFQPPQYPVIHQPPQETSEEILQAKENLMNSIETFLKKFNRLSFRETPKVLLLAWEKFLEIKHGEKQHPPEDIQDLLHKLLEDVRNVNEELAEYINTPSWNRPAFYFDDDDDEESSIPVKDIISELPLCVAITHDLPTEEPEYSLSMGDKHLDTISETKSDKVIKSSVENLVPIPSESEDFSDNESECDMPVCDDFTTFSNPLFDSNDDFTSSDDKSLSNEDVPKENFKMYLNPLFDDEENISTKIYPHSFNAESNLIESLLNQDTLIDSSPKFDYLLEEFSGELAHIDPIPPGIKEADFDLEEEICLVENLSYDNSSPRPPKERNSKNVDTIIESPSPAPIPVKDSDSHMEEIDLFLAFDDSMPPGIENDNYDSEGDIHFLEELLSNDPFPLPEIESSNLDHFLSPCPPPEPPDVEICFDVEPDTTVKNDFDELNEDECFDSGGGG